MWCGAPWPCNFMLKRNAGVPPERRIDVGIHLGDVVEEADGDLMGDGVNIAARLEGRRARRHAYPKTPIARSRDGLSSLSPISAPPPNYEHRRTDPGLLAASWRPHQSGPPTSYPSSTQNPARPVSPWWCCLSGTSATIPTGILPWMALLRA